MLNTNLPLRWSMFCFIFHFRSFILTKTTQIMTLDDDMECACVRCSIFINGMWTHSACTIFVRFGLISELCILLVGGAEEFFWLNWLFNVKRYAWYRHSCGFYVAYRFLLIADILFRWENWISGFARNKKNENLLFWNSTLAGLIEIDLAMECDLVNYIILCRDLSIPRYFIVLIST